MKTANAKESIKMLLMILFPLFLGILLSHFVFQISHVSGCSMDPTIKDGNYVFVKKWSHNYHRGQIIIAKEDCDMDADELMMAALDAGAEDFSEEEDSYEVLTAPEDFSDVRLKMEEAGIPMVSAEVTMIPQTYVDLTKEEDIKNIQKTLDLLDEDDDVQNVYHNWNEPEDDEE